MKATQALGLFVVSSMLSACGQSQLAEVMNKGNQFFGRDDMQSGLAMRMPQDPAIASKYHSQAQFSTAASIDRVAASDLPPPSASQPIMQVSFKEKMTPSSAPAAPVQVAPVQAAPAQAAPVQQTRQTTQLVSADVTAPGFVWPTEGRIISGFGPKPNGLVNDGINIEAAEGRPIWAAASGEVVYAGNGLEGYGNMVILRHEGGWMTAYAHASDMLVSKGMQVGQGDLLGYVGKTGGVQTAQLHFGIRKGKDPINPETLLPRRVASAN